jgi:hypothetical protein
MSSPAPGEQEAAFGRYSTVHPTMSKKTIPVDNALLVDCGEYFQKMGELFIVGIYRRFPEGLSGEPPSGLGDLVCNATNLAFSLELYLKALHAQLGEATTV